MAEKLPLPNIDPPVSRIDCLYILDEQRTEYMDTKQDIDSWDAQRRKRQALANLNLCLDFYPNGSPRDHIAMYEHPTEPITQEIPLNVNLGRD